MHDEDRTDVGFKEGEFLGVLLRGRVGGRRDTDRRRKQDERADHGVVVLVEGNRADDLHVGGELLLLRADGGDGIGSAGTGGGGPR